MKPIDDTTIGSWLLYIVASGVVFLMFSQLLGLALILNAVIALAVGLTARSMGKREAPVVLLGLLLGPIGALAGLIAAPGRKE